MSIPQPQRYSISATLSANIASTTVRSPLVTHNPNTQLLTALCRLRFGLYTEIVMRLGAENMLPATLALQCSAALCANRSGVIFTLTNVGLQMGIEPVVGSQVFDTSMVLIVIKRRTWYHIAFSGGVAVSKCPIRRVSDLLIPVSRVFRYEWRSFVSRLTDPSLCLLQTHILNKSKPISILPISILVSTIHPRSLLYVLIVCPVITNVGLGHALD